MLKGHDRCHRLIFFARVQGFAKKDQAVTTIMPYLLSRGFRLSYCLKSFTWQLVVLLQVKVVAETRGHAHAAELREALVSRGYPLIWQNEDMVALL